MAWKKVITSGSHAELAQVSASELNIPQNTTTTTGLEVLVDGGSGVIHKRDQELIQGSNTTYAAGTGFNFNALATGQNVFTLNLNQIDHDLLANFSASEHIVWEDSQSINIHEDNYYNMVISASSGIDINTLSATDSTFEISSSATQSHITAVGDLIDGDIGAYNNPADFNISTTSSIASASYLYGAAISASNWNQTSIQPLYVNNTASASVITSPDVLVQGVAEISGTFIYNDLEFVEQILQTHSGSHTFGGPASDTVQTFSGSIYVTSGVTASNGFSGSGAGLTNISPSNIGYETLTIGNGFSGSNFNFTSDSTMSVQFSGSDHGLGHPSDPLFAASAVQIAVDGVSTRMFATGSVREAGLGNTAIRYQHLTSSIIADHATASSVHASNEYLTYPTAAPTPTYHRKVTQTQLTTYIGDSITTASGNATGSVKEISVLPLTGSTAINHLFLSIESASTTPIISMGGNVQVGNAQWTASSPSAADQYQSVGNGGLGHGTQAESAAHILNTSQGTALTIGAIGNTIKISGSLLVNAPGETNISTHNLIVEDKFLLLGEGETTSTVDIGIQFGSDATSSNTILFNTPAAGAGRLSFGNSLDATTTLNASPNYHLIGVHSGSTATAAAVSANQKGNVLIDSAADIFLWV